LRRNARRNAYAPVRPEVHMLEIAALAVGAGPVRLDRVFRAVAPELVGVIEVW
jgi:hypothetical protein